MDFGSLGNFSEPRRTKFSVLPRLRRFLSEAPVFFIAVVVATIKASLVAMFFMHLKDDNRFNVLIFVGSLLFMGVFFVYTMNDTQHRGQWDESYGTRVSPATGEEAPGRGQYQEIRLEGGHGHGESGAATHAAPGH